MTEDLKKIESLSYNQECETCGNTGKIYGDPYGEDCPTCKPTNAPPASMGFNSHVIKPGLRANKAEDAGQTLEQPKCKTCGDSKRVCKRPASAKGLTPEIPCPDCKPDQPNQNIMIIEEIEGLMTCVNNSLYKLDRKVLGTVNYQCPHKLIGQALEEIDLFQKTTLFELRKSFE